MKFDGRGPASRVRQARGKRAGTPSKALAGQNNLIPPSVLEAELKPMLQEIVDEAISISGADSGCIQLLNQKSSALRIAAHRGLPRWWIDFWNIVSKGRGSSRVALKRKKPVVVEDVEKSPIFTGKALQVQLKAGVRAVQSTPIVSRAGEPLGTFSTQYKKPYRPDHRVMRLLDLLARHAGDMIGEAQYREALRRSEERLRALLTAGSVVYRMSPDWTEMRELDGNGFLSDTVAPTEKWLEKYIHPDDRAHVMEVIRKAIRHKNRFRLEHRVRLADGTLGWTFSHAVPILDANGKITEWFGTASDVTEWKRTEEEAQAIMDLAPVAVFIARDSKGLDIRGNRAAYEMVRLPEGSNISKSARANRRPGRFRIFKNGIEIPPNELPVHAAAATGQRIHNLEMELVHSDGTRRNLLGNTVPILVGDNKRRGAVGTFLDVTTLKEAEEKFRAFVENAPIAIAIYDPTGKMAIVNPEAERLFGYMPGELIGQPVEKLVPQRAHRKHTKVRRAYMKKPRVRPMGVGLELTALRKDGYEFPVEISLSPVKTTAGTFVAATIFDLTERKRLEEQIRLTTILQERARVARDLHDTLAQGFTGIIMQLEAAEATSPNLPKETRILIEKAERVARENLQEARRFLEELSALPDRRVSDFVGSLRKLANHASRDGKSRVTFTLRGKPLRLDDALNENLLFIARQAMDNALQHAQANAVHIGIDFNKNEVRLQVQDNGRGFDLRKADRGFGLINMRDRAKYVGGQFTLNSRNGKGTRVAVTVPLAGLRSSATSP